jgi:hypothetical protein
LVGRNIGPFAGKCAAKCPKSHDYLVFSALKRHLNVTADNFRQTDCSVASAFAARAGDGDMEVSSAFGLSRIQAEGWNAARKFLRGGDPGDAKSIAALNPYSSNPEKERWYAGFNSAVEKL